MERMAFLFSLYSVFHSVAALRFCLIQGDISLCQEAGSPAFFCGVGYSDANGNSQFSRACFYRAFGNLPANSLKNAFAVNACPQRHNQQKLLATYPRDRIIFTDSRKHQLRNPAQNFIPRMMPPSVVNPLEMVNIAHSQSQPFSMAFAANQLFFQPFKCGAPVQQFG
jgi:hypothetical protein